MARVQWKTYRTITLFVCLFIVYLSVRVRNYEHKAFVFLPTIHPNEAWEFVADFSNMKYLNPTIVDFDIIEESGKLRPLEILYQILGKVISLAVSAQLRCGSL
ncbi:hypothetical protein NQ315_006332 [Exocentrus adspersus]|uniref:Uncharacterized protein n=1 Tax=Exocentrus adspersus TaxID=1586481 RepID=A0AAV8VZY5_9CUCU|nr:hypothetical protein NQ315_006332 [Exocentrus adspersus]